MSLLGGFLTRPCVNTLSYGSNVRSPDLFGRFDPPPCPGPPILRIGYSDLGVLLVDSCGDVHMATIDADNLSRASLDAIAMSPATLVADGSEVQIRTEVDANWISACL